jgi:hypothetical protein
LMTNSVQQPDVVGEQIRSVVQMTSHPGVTCRRLVTVLCPRNGVFPWSLVCRKRRQSGIRTRMHRV